MCMQRDKDEPEKIVFPFTMFEFIDLTVEEATEEDAINLNDVQNDQWNPYSLLPSSDEEEPALIRNDNVGRNTERNTTGESSNGINQNIILPNRPRHISFEINGTQEFQRFELNIPQILLSMSRISHQLFEQAHPPPRN